MAPGGCATLYAGPISYRRCPVSRTGGPAPGLRHPLRLGGQLSGPSGGVRKADKQHGYLHMARTRRMQYTGQGAALQSRQKGTPVGEKDRNSPDLTFVAPSHQSNPERQSGTRGGMSWRGTPSPPPSGGETESQRGRTLMASVSGCYKGPSGLSTSTWPRTSMPTGHPTHAGDGMP